MADLTRLRTITLDVARPATVIGGVLYHLFPSATVRTLLDQDMVRKTVAWLAAAPASLYGEVVGAAGVVPADFARLLDQCDDRLCADAATYAHSMVVPDKEWDRAVRDEYVTEVSIHGPRAARVQAQTSAEFAAIDALTAAGFQGVDDAVSAVADLRRAVPNTFVIRSHQYARSRHAVVARFSHSDGTVRLVYTPWCLSRRAAIAVAAVHLSDLRRRVVEDRLIKRARTVQDFATRTSLQAVRDITGPALALLTRYTYSPSCMAFVDGDGAVVQGVGSRAPHVAVAFAAVFSSGRGDALRTMAEARSLLAEGLDPVIPQHALDYYHGADSPWTSLALFLRYLGHARNERHDSPWGDRVNKGAMLGYVARARTKVDRNTAACINRFEEVATLVATFPNTGPVLYVVEWGGHCNASAVLASAAVSGVDMAVDVFDAGVDVPGLDVFSDSDDPTRHYQCYLASAEDKGLPRMPVVPYKQGTPLAVKLSSVRAAIAGADPSVRVVYITGGVSQLADTPLSVCIDTSTRIDAIRAVQRELNVVYHTSEFLVPPVCDHCVSMPADSYLLTGGQGVDSCVQCESFYRALAVCTNFTDSSELRIVKPRSIFGHNAHFAVETAPPGVDAAESTAITVDSAVACNLMRNHQYDLPPPPGPPGTDVTSPTLMDLTRPIIASVHLVLSGFDRARMDAAQADRVAASIT